MKDKKTIIIFSEKERSITATGIKQRIIALDPTVIVIIIDIMELRNRALVDFVSNLLSININVEKIEAQIKKRRAYRDIDTIPKTDLSMKSSSSYKNTENIILRYTPDLVITLGTGAIYEVCAVRNKLKSSFKIVSVVDDYVLNKNLIYENIDAYLVENIGVKTDMVNCYVPENKIFIGDIPLMQEANHNKLDKRITDSITLESRLATILLVVPPNDKDEFRWQIEVLEKYQKKYNILVFVYDNAETVLKCNQNGLKVFSDLSYLAFLYDVADIILSCPYSAVLEPGFQLGKLVAISKPNKLLESKIFQYLSDKTAHCENDQRLVYFLDKYPREEYEKIRQAGKKVHPVDSSYFFKMFLN
jgi:hypothetical protein